MGNCCEIVTGGPNEVIIKSGCCLSQPFLVIGGRTCFCGCCQKIQRISLSTITLSIRSDNVYTKLGVPISVTGIAQVKIESKNQEMLRAACQQFMDKSEKEIKHVIHETLEGHQRAIMAHMTVEEIFRDRKKFSTAVFQVASADLVHMGISVVSYVIKEIHDKEGYLKSLGFTRTAQVKRDARIGEAEARRDAGIREAIAEEQRMTARYANDAEIAMAQRDFLLKKAQYDQEVKTRKATSDMAYHLQKAKTQQQIMEENMQIAVVERGQQILVQDQEIQRKEKELEATIKKPSEALKFKLETLAQASKAQVEIEAEAAASAIRLKGEAEAYAIEAKAKAEAEQMAKKADAWKDYQDAAKVDMVLEVLPKMAAEIAAPLSQAKKVTMISSGKGDVGAAKLTGEVLQVMEKLPEVVEGMTGVNISKSLKMSQRRI